MHDWVATFGRNTTVEFADNTSMVGIFDNDKTAYQKGVDNRKLVSQKQFPPEPQHDGWADCVLGNETSEALQPTHN